MLLFFVIISAPFIVENVIQSKIFQKGNID
jgi:hypothetical protein